MNEWQAEKEWSDRFIPEIRRIVAGYVVLETDLAEDRERCGDLVVLRAREVRVACRVRRFHYWKRYGSEFTLRAWLRNGKPTELHKIRSGWGDFLFYGFATEHEDRLYDWFIGDLDILRAWIEDLAGRANLDAMVTRNVDGRTGFLTIRKGSLPTAFFVAQAPTKRAIQAELFR